MPPRDRTTVPRLAAALLTVAGPAMLAVVGFHVPLAVWVISVGGAVAVDRVGPTSLVRRAAVVLGAGAACAAFSAALAGIWLIIGLLLADWVALGRRVPGLPTVHRSLVLPGLVLGVPWWGLFALDQVGPIPCALGFGVAVLLLRGLTVADRHRHLLLLAVGAAYSLAAFGAVGTATAARPEAGAASLRYALAGLLASVVTMVVLARHAEDDRPWSLRGVGPLSLAMPALLWLVAATAVLVAATARSPYVGYRAWDAYTSTLVAPVLDTFAYTAIGAAIAALLGVGAVVSVRGGAALGGPLRFLTQTLVWAGVLSWAWTIPAP